MINPSTWRRVWLRTCTCQHRLFASCLSYCLVLHWVSICLYFLLHLSDNACNSWPSYPCLLASSMVHVPDGAFGSCSGGTRVVWSLLVLSEYLEQQCFHDSVRSFRSKTRILKTDEHFSVELRRQFSLQLQFLLPTLWSWDVLSEVWGATIVF
jgi:hypothetical protein